jgi:hypothetical protein
VASRDPVACDLSAIPADQRAAHVALVRSLFFADEHVARATDAGVLVELPPERLGDVVRFVENERRCCAHLAFTLEVPSRGATITLHVAGPGAWEELRALAGIHG